MSLSIQHEDREERETHTKAIATGSRTQKYVRLSPEGTELPKKMHRRETKTRPKAPSSESEIRRTLEKVNWFVRFSQRRIRAVELITQLRSEPFSLQSLGFKRLWGVGGV